MSSSAPGSDVARAASPAGARTTDGTWSLADLAARKPGTLDRNDVSTTSKFDVASLSSSRTDASILDTPIGAAGTPSASFAAAEPAGDDDPRDGDESAPSLPPPPTTRKSIKLPGIAQIPGDDPDDPVIDPPQAAQPGSIAAKLAAPALPHARAKTPSSMSGTWPGGSSAVKGPLSVAALLRSPRRLAIVAGTLVVVLTIVVFATRGRDSAPAAGPTAPERANAGVDEPVKGETATAQPATGETATGETAGEAATGEPATGEPATGEAATGEAATGEAATDEAATDEAATGEVARNPAAATGASATNDRDLTPSVTTTEPAVTKTAAEPPRPRPTAAKPAVTKAVKQPAKPTTKAPTGKHAVATAKPTKRPTTRPATKTKKPANNAPAKKPAWDPNSLFPKRKRK